MQSHSSKLLHTHLRQASPCFGILILRILGIPRTCLVRACVQPIGVYISRISSGGRSGCSCVVVASRSRSGSSGSGVGASPFVGLGLVRSHDARNIAATATNTSTATNTTTAHISRITANATETTPATISRMIGQHDVGRLSIRVPAEGRLDKFVGARAGQGRRICTCDLLCR